MFSGYPPYPGELSSQRYVFVRQRSRTTISFALLQTRLWDRERIQQMSQYACVVNHMTSISCHGKSFLFFNIWA